MHEPIEFTIVSTVNEVDDILELQAANHPSALTPETMARQGFVTVRHDRDVLRRMNEAAPAIVAKAGSRVVGYALVMPRKFAADPPILRPLFDRLDTLSWKGTPLRGNPRWFVMGQICIADGYRGAAIFDDLYRTMAGCYGDRYDFTVTEVAARNTRSLRAHATNWRSTGPLRGVAPSTRRLTAYLAAFRSPIAQRYDDVRMKSCPSEMAIVLRQ